MMQAIVLPLPTPAPSPMKLKKELRNEAIMREHYEEKYFS